MKIVKQNENNVNENKDFADCINYIETNRDNRQRGEQRMQIKN